MITMINEAQVLDINFRKAVIEQIKSDSNTQRKKEKQRAYDVYKDLTKKWVIESLAKEFSEKTVEQMKNRASNVSICRKIVDKKAKAYSGGVIRGIEGEEENTVKLKMISDSLSVNNTFKKVDRFLELLQNCAIQVIYENDPLEEDDNGIPKKKIRARLFLPHQYDVVCHAHDYCNPMLHVLSDFYNTSTVIYNNFLSSPDGLRDGATFQEYTNDSVQDISEKKKTYIWWTKTYHLTTDDKGNILQELSPDDYLKPIARKNFIDFYKDQDDSYWCTGGDDLIDGSVLINVLLTDMYSIMNIQGWGQLVVKGKNIPEDIKGGPHRALVFEYDSGDPSPSVEYVSSNPPVAEWRQCIEQYIALLLSTNNLSAKNISTKLEGSNLTSGISKVLDEAESTENIEDKQSMFQEKEQEFWPVVFDYQNYLFNIGQTNSELTEIGEISTNKRVKVKFLPQKVMMTENDKVDVLQKKKDSQLYTLTELLMIDNPDLSEEDAEKKALELMEDRIKYSFFYMNKVNEVVDNMNNELQNGNIDNNIVEQ